MGGVVRLWLQLDASSVGFLLFEEVPGVQLRCNFHRGGTLKKSVGSKRCVLRQEYVLKIADWGPAISTYQQPLALTELLCDGLPYQTILVVVSTWGGFASRGQFSMSRSKW